MDEVELNSEFSKHKVKFMTDEEIMYNIIMLNDNIENYECDKI